MKINEASVLVVDDETALCEIFGKWLRLAGCREVQTAVNGEQALQILAKDKVDVLITDIRMPVMDGITLVRKLTTIQHHVACIIFVSGFSEIDLREMYDLGVEAFLAKPFRVEELSTALANAVAARQSLWKTPLTPAPRQSLTLPSQTSPQQSASPEIDFRIGRGGFSTHTNETITLGKVAFNCTPSVDHPALTGQGYVRWRSKDDQAIGVEFSFIDQPGRDWVVSEIEGQKPRSFIPALLPQPAAPPPSDEEPDEPTPE